MTSKDKEVEPASNKLGVAIQLLEEKVAREYQLTPDEVKASTITIKDGLITVKKGKRG